MAPRIQSLPEPALPPVLVNQRAVARACESVEQIDMSMILVKLTDEREPPSLPRAEAERACGEYRMFLALLLVYPDEVLVPSKLVDLVWHQHILDTWAYQGDCDRLFGFFLHHFPYLGLRGPEDERYLAERFERTAGLVRAHFASEYEVSSYCGGGGGGCGGGGGGGCGRVDVPRSDSR
ncbi:MAG: hypothetical protein WBA45_14800 [Microthrixaceae bacterium]